MDDEEIFKQQHPNVPWNQCPAKIKGLMQKARQAGWNDSAKMRKEFHCTKHGWACERCESCEKEAYLAGQRSKTAYKLGFDEGHANGRAQGRDEVMETCDGCSGVQYERGQAKLIEKLRSKPILQALAKAWYEESELTDATPWDELDRFDEEKDGYLEMTPFIMETAIRLASESFEGNVFTKTHSPDDKPEKPKKKRRNGYAKRL